MSAVAETRPGGITLPNSPRQRAFRLPFPAVWPLLAAVANGLAFYAVRPNVGDLQAALARQSAAASGVGLTYWFEWFGGGAAPGSYSVLTPALSTLVGAPLVGVIATALAAPLAQRALAGTPHALLGTWLAVITAGWNLWAGRVPFALGCTVALVAVIGLRERRRVTAVVAAILTVLCSPVPGAFLAFVVAIWMWRQRAHRPLGLAICIACGVTFVVCVVLFGNPGPEGFAVASGFLTAGTALAMLFARPAPQVRALLWCTALAAVVLTAFPNGMGSNFTRLPWMCLPAAVAATATARRRVVALALAPAVALGVNATIVDLVRSSAPSAAAIYYQPLIQHLEHLPALKNYRLEVVGNPVIHTASYALLGHAALAGGYETQEQNQVNALLSDPLHLNPRTYKQWLDTNAVGYVALDRTAVNTSPEYQLVRKADLPYLQLIAGGRKWLLYRVADPRPIVPAPLQVLTATQAELRVRVPCACTTPLRLRYSKFLTATAEQGLVVGQIRNDGTGWTTLTTSRPGVYTLRGDLAGPLR